MIKDILNKRWKECLISENLSDSSCVSESKFDPSKRTYKKNDTLIKITITGMEFSGHLRAQNLFGEYKILSNCKNLKNIPYPKQYKRTKHYEILEMQYIDGYPINQKKLSLSKFIRIFFELCKVLFLLSLKGISHNDLINDNVFIDRRNELYLIDFDQAFKSRFLPSFLMNFFGIECKGVKVYGSMITLLKSCFKNIFPDNYLKLLRKNFYKNKMKNFEIPVIPREAPTELKLLSNAWNIARMSDASSPGLPIAYYSLNYSGYHFPGERRWEDRWEYLKDITNYKDKTILELGCNMGLLSAHLLKEKKAHKVIAVDHDRGIIGAAKLISNAFDVKPELKLINFDSNDKWENELNQDRIDIVFALNVLNWVENKSRFLKFLGMFNELIYEGHDSLQEESDRLKRVGFINISTIIRSERDRYLLHCLK